MKQLLEYIVPNIVNHPEDVIITEEVTSDGTSLMIEVNPEDMGRVIGKSGKVIKSIRQIARVMAIKRGVRIHIDILDKNAPIPTESSDEAAVSAPPTTDDIIVEIPEEKESPAKKSKASETIEETDTQ